MTTTPEQWLAERARVRALLRERESELRQRDVPRLWLTASVGRGQAGPESDVDQRNDPVR